MDNSDFYFLLNIIRTQELGIKSYEFSFPEGKLSWDIVINDGGSFLVISESRNVKDKLADLIQIVCTNDNNYGLSLYKCAVKRISVLPKVKLMKKFAQLNILKDFFKLRDPIEYINLPKYITVINVVSEYAKINREDIKYFNDQLSKNIKELIFGFGNIILSLPIYFSTFMELLRLVDNITLIPVVLFLNTHMNEGKTHEVHIRLENIKSKDKIEEKNIQRFIKYRDNIILKKIPNYTLQIRK